MNGAAILDIVNRAGQMVRRLEKYELLDEIGHGGMATVYRARDSSLDRLVALKVLHPHLRRTGEARARFTREAKSVARLHHPHILEIYDYSGEASDETYIAAELLTGPTLKDFIQDQGEVPAEIAACIALQVAAALSEAHAKGIIHRDVKPENVLVHRDECVKLTDFGIAHMVDTHTFTATGQILGSPGHMAPEQVEGRECDERSDVFSLGTVLYYCALGRLPFVGRNPHHLLKQLLEGDYPDPLRLRPVIGSDFADILNKALSRDPADRYQNAGALADALNAFLEELEIEDPPGLLSEYLANPTEVRGRVIDRSIRRCLSIGAAAAKRRDIPKAQSALSRVLAMDDGNERALKLLGSLGRRRRRQAASLLAGSLLVLGIGTLAYAGWIRGDPASESTPPTPAAPSPPPVERSEPPSEANVPDSTHVETDNVETDNEEAAPSVEEVQPKRQSTTPVQDRRRWVVFNPTPSNVSIGVDGGPLRPFGPDYQKVRLRVGKHTFRLIGGEGCCKPWVRTIRVPPGRGDFQLDARLEFKPARLYLRGPAPPEASVRITLPGDREVRGKIREILKIPMRTLTVSAQVKIEAPGYEPYSSVVRLRAGAEVTDHRFALERASENP